VTLVLYAFSTDVRSSRSIERHCRQDVAYRVVTGNVVPDHATIARFIVRHQNALGGLFSEVLSLCDQAGLIAPGVIAIDGTRLAGNASKDRNHSSGRSPRRSSSRSRLPTRPRMRCSPKALGGELPEQLRNPEGRREFFGKARRKLAGEGEELGEEPEAEASAEPEFPGLGVHEFALGRQWVVEDPYRRRGGRRPRRGVPPPRALQRTSPPRWCDAGLRVYDRPCAHRVR
jgi:hypothetical protein